MRRSIGLALALGLAACGSDVSAIPGTQASFDLRAEWNRAETFFSFPYPSDLRLGPGGGPDLAGLPNPESNVVVEAVRSLAEHRRGFPQTPVAYFRFSAPLAPRHPEDVIPAEKGSPVLLLDVDPGSESKGTLYPTVASTPAPDPYVPTNLLSVAPRPGIVLAAGRRYAFVVLRSFGDALGKALGVPRDLRELIAGKTPAGSRGAAARALHAPLWTTLREIGIDPDQVAAATVFTTGDVVGEVAAFSETLRARYTLAVTDLRLDPDDGDHPRFCELLGKIRMPQFQKGTPPFDTEGLFELDGQGNLVEQRQEEIPVTVTLPKATMPASGYPLLLYVHGSGGLSGQVVDRGSTAVAGGAAAKGEGPAHVVAPFGIATAASAMPLNPERLPGAGDLAYLNFGNLPAFRDTFRQGIFEQRLLLDALAQLEIPPTALGACAGPALPTGATAFKLDLGKLALMGQSMGGQYVNMVGAVDPRARAVIPTGAGGLWSYLILKTPLVPASLIGALLGTSQPLDFMHPGLHVFQTATEAADPIVYVPHLSRRPLPGHPARHVYEPAGPEDEYVPVPVYDAMALAYGHEQVGTQVWPSMQQALALTGRSGLKPYPIQDNLISLGGSRYTGVVVQYERDEIMSGHHIAFQLDAVKYQYGCFLESFLRTGTASVFVPAALGTPCPQ